MLGDLVGHHYAQLNRLPSVAPPPANPKTPESRQVDTAVGRYHDLSAHGRYAADPQDRSLGFPWMVSAGSMPTAPVRRSRRSAELSMHQTGMG